MQATISYLPNIAVDEHIAAVQVSVNNTGIVVVQVLEPHQDLPRPLLQRLDRHVAVLLPVLPQVPGGADLGDEVEGAAPGVGPDVVEGDDVVVAEGPEEADLRVEAV